MTTDSRSIALAHFDRLNAGDLAGAAALMAEDAINHAAVPEAQGRAGYLRIMTKLTEAMPDMTYTVEDVLVDGDRVAVRVTVSGTQKGPLAMTRFPLPATGKFARFEQIHIVRVTSGQVVEHWGATDMIAMLRQLGFQIAPAT